MGKMTLKITLLFVVLGFAWTGAGGRQPNGTLFAGRYKAGQRISYVMNGVNENWHYQIEASGVVKMDSKGSWVLEYAWSHLVSNGRAVVLPPTGTQFRISLDQHRPPLLPDLHVVPPVLIGPITDLDTFYVDLWLATRLGNKLNTAGDHADLNLGVPASWADGKHVMIGESAVDFKFTLVTVDHATESATLLVQHVPPAQSRVPLPAPWMRMPLGGKPANWVMVAKKGSGFVAGVAEETFEVRMKVSLADGKVLSASMQNLVKGEERDCRNAALTNCGNPHPLQISRQISVSLKR
jgi:hypothetical protein